MNDDKETLDWLCECGHRLGDHHTLDEYCCIDGCICDQFSGGPWDAGRNDDTDSDS